ncbi:pyridoxal 5'-phosphate synthase glutaminase subunit PdxT [Clostridium sp. ZS2-4]|uniref:pyridoxal 5'-phosphate synthase glutaminase subunit PdxT n=1 Tax=Clostridium sp. ZS2-4 TaxID=2987703 RepID=UPI00227C28D8|nr:pyridoxal 5'-phosphate synthase glutaminase subunit PdxT [Clostridium sp. ZS2-4]MCY6355635.1 pyridoxal 5'-phosphate synthase glutaminase subunit PdxT [Clostridium sp. ZS2-4]
MKKIGVLALQGAFNEHIEIIKSLGHEGIEIRKAEQLNNLDGIILPGGESTAMGKLLDDFQIKETLVNKINNGLPVWGTCAGMILLAKNIGEQEEAHLKVMDIHVKRNAYGSQLDSFIIEENVPEISDNPIPLVFIRAPYIEKVGNGVEILKELDGKIVAAKEDNMLVTSFHPELTGDKSVHKYFIETFF